MSKINRWKEIFGYAGKQKTRVRVGKKYEDMTGTQAYRFDELKQPERADSQPDASTAPRKTRYALAEASDRLNVSEKDLLQEAASGSVKLYVDVGGVKGRWRRGANASGSIVSSVQTLTSGYLALTSRSCNEMANYGSVNVLVLEFHCPSDPSAVDLDRETMAALSAWGDCEKYFCLEEPLLVDRNKIVLLAPLPVLAGR
jgi:hypothetical protein